MAETLLKHDNTKKKRIFTSEKSCAATTAQILFKFEDNHLNTNKRKCMDPYCDRTIMLPNIPRNR